mgnify:CR=1 FL=1
MKNKIVNFSKMAVALFAILGAAAGCAPTTYPSTPSVEPSVEPSTEPVVAKNNNYSIKKESRKFALFFNYKLINRI